MAGQIAFFLLLVASAHYLSAREPMRESRTLFGNLFKFLSEPCIAVSNRNGVCLSHSECTRIGGSAEGSCLNPFGVCCIFLITCGNKTNAKELYFVEPVSLGYNRTGPQCQAAVTKTNDAICQVRVDFVRFVLPPPVLGECKDGYLNITGMDPHFSIPLFCGANKGQHVYLPMDESKGPLKMTIKAPEDARWELKVTQIPCDSPHLAPSECLQYFDSINGTLKSFNFDQRESWFWGYNNNLEYAMCIRHQFGYCSVLFQSSADNFKIGDTWTTLTDSECTEDFLQFPPSRDEEGKVQPSRICGSVFSPVSGSYEFRPLQVSAKMPLVVSFTSDNIGSDHRGFKIDYAMQPCEFKTLVFTS